MEFANLDDDLFSEERKRGNADESYSARFCANGWFLETDPDELVSNEDKMSIQKHTADYFYFKKEYEAAVLKYKDILSVLPASNTTVRRECYEGISRSCLKIGIPEEAFEYADKMHATSKTVEQNTSSCPVMIDAGIAAQKFLYALSAAQLFVSLHSFSSDAWLKLSWCYACLHSIELYETKNLIRSSSVKSKSNKVESNNSLSSDTTFKPSHEPFCLKSIIEKAGSEELLNEQINFTEEEIGYQLVCACLYRSLVMLKRTEGTTFGFALESSLVWQRRIERELNRLLDEKSLSFIKSVVTKYDDIYSRESPLNECTTEFVDRGSSKFQKEEMDNNIEVVSNKSFERRWFKWIK